LGLSKDDDEDDDDGGGGGGEAPSSSADRSIPLTLWAALPHMPGGGRGGKSARAVSFFGRNSWNRYYTYYL